MAFSILGLGASKASRTGLLEGSDGAGFVVLDVEHSVKLGELQKVMDLLGQVEQLQVSALIL
jgi:hypothetical protein